MMVDNAGRGLRVVVMAPYENVCLYTVGAEWFISALVCFPVVILYINLGDDTDGDARHQRD